MSANTETTGAPEGYRPCPNTPCRRWMHPGRASCVMCTWGELRDKPDSMFVRMMKKEPDWTPPIAAPAAHVERRRGQRWKSVHRFSNGDVLTVVGTLGERSGRDAWSLTDVERSDGITFASCFVDLLWTARADQMTLLADAPPGPAKLPGCTPCRIRGGDGLDESCEPAKSPPAQEAPKAAPVCCSKCGSSGETNFYTYDCRTTLLCVPCQDVATKWIKGQAGKPYAGPERLPKPQLAADWVEDCVPTVWR